MTKRTETDNGNKNEIIFRTLRKKNRGTYLSYARENI